MKLPPTAFLCLLVSLCCALPVRVAQSQDAEVSHQEKELYRRTGAEGTVGGKVLFDGVAPLRKRIDMSQDANCFEIVKNPRSEDLLVVNGKLANVFVYVKGGELARFAFETPTTGVVLDQQQCRFVPRVLGIRAGQPLTILNTDPTTHNVHPAPRVNPEWNQMQMAYGTPIEKRFMRQETLIPVKCNQHPWMKAYIGVLAHPFFSVSSKDGSFSINGLPPGEYTLVAWHETLGERTVPFAVAPGETKSLDVLFDAKTSGTVSNALKVGASIDVR